MNELVSEAGPAIPEPMASVIVPVLSGERTLERCLRSVLQQSMTELELIVIDDGSTDGTRRVAEEIDDARLVLLSQPNAGVSAARNVGIARARGPLVVFLDADDEVEADWPSRLVAPFVDPSVGLVCCGGVYFDESNGSRVLLPSRSGGLLDDFVVLFMAGAFMVRSDVLASAGNYAPLSYGENLDLGYRITQILRGRRLSAV